MKRARGEGFFAAVDTLPYQPRGVLLGQETENSCVAACCRMLLLDQFPTMRQDYRYAESFLRTALATDEDGSPIAMIPEVLRQFGLAQRYIYRRDFTLEELRSQTVVHSVIAVVNAKSGEDLHALIVDAVWADAVAIRDPLPEGRGSAYRVSLTVFLPRWLDSQTGCGGAVTMLE